MHSALILSGHNLQTLSAAGLHSGLRVLDVAHNRLAALPDAVQA